MTVNLLNDAISAVCPDNLLARASQNTILHPGQQNLSTRTTWYRQSNTIGDLDGKELELGRKCALCRSPVRLERCEVVRIDAERCRQVRREELIVICVPACVVREEERERGVGNPVCKRLVCERCITADKCSGSIYRCGPDSRGANGEYGCDYVGWESEPR